MNKLFKIHFALHFEANPEPVISGTKGSRLKKITQLLDMLITKYATIKSLRSRLLRQDPIKFAAEYFTQFERSVEVEILDASFDKRGLGISVTILTSATSAAEYDEDGDVPVTRALLKQLLSRADARRNAINSGTTPLDIVAYLPENFDGYLVPDVFLGSFKLSNEKVTQLRKLPEAIPRPALPEVAALEANRFHATSTYQNAYHENVNGKMVVNEKKRKRWMAAHPAISSMLAGR